MANTRLTLRPNGVFATFGTVSVGNTPGVQNTYSVATGRTNYAAVLASAPTVSGDFVFFDHASDGAGLIVSFPLPAIPVGSQIRDVFTQLQTDFFAPGRTAPANLSVNHGYKDPNTGLFFAGAPDTLALTNQIFTLTATTSLVATDFAGQPWSITEMNNLLVSVNKAFPQNGTIEYRFIAMETYIDINQPPLVTSVTVGSPQISTFTPTVTWLYSDLESDIQEQFQVKIFPSTYIGTSPQSDPGAIYDSGLVAGTATSFPIPPHIGLQNGSSYLIYVFASDIGSNGRFNVNTSNVFNFTVVVAPFLMPGFNFPSTPGLDANSGLIPIGGTVYYDTQFGVFQNLRANIRVNTLTSVDASGELAGIGSIGSWVCTVGGGSVVTSGVHYYGIAGIGLKGGSGTCTFTHTAQPVISGVLYQALTHLHANTVARNWKLGINWFDGSGVLINGLTVLSPTVPGVVGSYVTNTVFARAPANAVTGQIVVLILSMAAGEVHVVDCNGLTNDSLSIIENGGFENGIDGGNPNAFWFTNVAGGNTIATVTGTSNDGTVGYADPGVNIMDVNIVAPNSTAILRAGGSGVYMGLHGRQWLFSCNAKQISGGTNFNMGAYNSDATTLPATPTTATLSSSWSRVSQLLDATTLALTVNTQAQIKSAASAIHFQCDNFMLEPVFPFTGGNFESTTVGPSVAETLGGWIWDRPQTGNEQTTISPGGQRSGNNCLQIGTAAGLPPMSVSQFVTVSGYSTIRFDGFVTIFSTFAAKLGLTFFDSGGIPLPNPTTGLAPAEQIFAGNITTGSYQPITTGNVTVPRNAAYVQLRLIGASDGVTNLLLSRWDDFTFTPTGTLTSSSYIDGGWSAGGYAASSFLNVQRQNENSTWTNVRVQNQPAVNFVKAIPSTELIWNDFEWNLEPADDLQTQQLIWRAQAFFQDPTGYQAAPSSMLVLAIPSAGPFRVTADSLIDPLDYNSKTLIPIKKLSISIPETLGKYSGMGRKNVVIIGDVVQGEHLSIDTLTVSHAAWEILKAQINKQTTLLLRLGDGYQWYVRPVKRDMDRTWTGSYVFPAMRDGKLEFDEQDPTP